MNRAFAFGNFANAFGRDAALRRPSVFSSALFSWPATFFLSAALMRDFNRDDALDFLSVRFDCHSASFWAAICAIVRPVFTDSSSRFFEIGFRLSPLFKSNHCVFPPSIRSEERRVGQECRSR